MIHIQLGYLFIGFPKNQKQDGGVRWLSTWVENLVVVKLMNSIQNPFCVTLVFFIQQRVVVTHTISRNIYVLPVPILNFRSLQELWSLYCRWLLIFTGKCVHTKRTTLYDEWCLSGLQEKPIEKVEIDGEMAPQVNKLLHSLRLEHLIYLSSSSCSLRMSDLFMK